MWLPSSRRFLGGGKNSENDVEVLLCVQTLLRLPDNTRELCVREFVFHVPSGVHRKRNRKKIAAAENAP